MMESKWQEKSYDVLRVLLHAHILSPNYNSLTSLCF